MTKKNFFFFFCKCHYEDQNTFQGRGGGNTLHACVRACVCVCACVHVCVHACMCVCMCQCPCLYECMLIHVYLLVLNVYVCVCVCRRQWTVLRVS